MKSSFLLAIAFTFITHNLHAQVTTGASTFDKFYERLKITYFGVLTTPHLDDMTNGHWENSAISTPWSLDSSGKGEGTNRDTWPTHIWHQLSFSYNFGAKLAFIVNPRFMTPLASPVDMARPEDRSFIMLDDFLVGFQGVIYSSDNGKFNFWVRPGVRLPTSRASRNSTNRLAGSLTHQLDFTYSPTYDFNKTWQVGLFGLWRQWIFEDKYDFTRLRLVNNPYVQYTIDDVSKLQLYYEFILETDRRGKPAGDRDAVLKDVWQNVLLGYSRDVTSKLNLMPFLSLYINDNPITDKSLWAGVWISYKIK